MFLDVWPKDLFDLNHSDEFDTSSLFQLQLACILHMVLHFNQFNYYLFNPIN